MMRLKYPTLLIKLHEGLMQVNEPYGHSVAVKEVVPMVWLKLPLKQLLADNHAQTKPRLISQQVIREV